MAIEGYPPNYLWTFQDGSLWAFLIVTIVVIAIASWFSRDGFNSKWYNDLKKPSWTPPRQAFMFIWIVLYLMIIYGTYVAWRQADCDQKQWLLVAFAVQLILNALWIVVFFRLQNLDWALVVLALLVVAILYQLYVMSHINQSTALFLAPYLLWVGIAAILNLSILVNNSKNNCKH